MNPLNVPGETPDNSGEFGMPGNDQAAVAPARPWVGPPPPTAERAEIVELPKPQAVHRYAITAGELDDLELVAFIVEKCGTNVSASLLVAAKNARMIARKVRGE